MAHDNVGLFWQLLREDNVWLRYDGLRQRVESDQIIGFFVLQSFLNVNLPAKYGFMRFPSLRRTEIKLDRLRCLLSPH